MMLLIRILVEKVDTNEVIKVIKYCKDKITAGSDRVMVNMLKSIAHSVIKTFNVHL